MKFRGFSLAVILSSVLLAGCASFDACPCRQEGFVALDPLADFVGVKCGLERFPDRGWTFEDGVLTVHPVSKIENGKCVPLPPEEAKAGGGGDICTRRTYRDFAFALEFRLTKAANSGIKYFFEPGKNRGTCEEYQILDGAHPDAVKGRDGNRRVASLYDLFPAHADAALKPLGEWNSAMVVSRGRAVQHWLNGRLVLEYERGSDAFRRAVDVSKYSKWGTEGLRWGELEEGRILLQDHTDSTVSFRNIRIKEL